MWPTLGLHTGLSSRLSKHILSILTWTRFCADIKDYPALEELSFSLVGETDSNSIQVLIEYLLWRHGTVMSQINKIHALTGLRAHREDKLRTRELSATKCSWCRVGAQTSQGALREENIGFSKWMCLTAPQCHPVPESTRTGTTKTLVHWTGVLAFQMERSTVAPLGRWPKAREGECGAPSVGFGGYWAGWYCSVKPQADQTGQNLLKLSMWGLLFKWKNKENSSPLT